MKTADSEDLGVVAQEVVVNASKSQRKKRKTTEGNINMEISKPTPRTRGQRGLLKDFVEMPMDILYEILCELDPIDLLNLARTTKALRAVLMSRLSMFIWKSARSHIAGLPECPDDLNEPQYAALVFDTRCSFCQKTVSITHISWSARVKCCNKCLKLNFTNPPDFFIEPFGDYDSEQGYPDLLIQWVPHIKYMHREYSRANGTSTAIDCERLMVLKEVSEQWEAMYAAFTDSQCKYHWCLRVLRERAPIEQHARACSIWYEARKSGASDAKILKILKRYEILVDYVKGLDLEEALYNVPPTIDVLDLLSVRDVIFEWKGRFDESTLGAFEEVFTKKLLAVKKDRERLELRELLLGRKQVLCEIHNKAVQNLKIPYPNLATFYRIAEAHDLVDHSRPPKDALRVPFKHVISLWRRQQDDKLFELITESKTVFDPTSVFDLATTVFACCGRDSSSPMRHHQIVEHSCFGSFADSGSMYKREFNAAFEERCWSDKARTCVKFRADLVKPIERFVEMCELDPKVTTAREMDELNPIFECRTCSSVEKGRLTMTWARAISHPCARRQKSIKTKTFVLLDEHESSQVRFGMALEENRAIRKACRIMCPHCKYRVSGHDKYLQHMRDEHDVLEVPDLLDLDYYYTPSDDTTTPLYRFFPSAR